MPFDILIFAVIAAFLALKLKSVLGTRSGEERTRPNPFVVEPAPAAKEAVPTITLPLQKPAALVDETAHSGLDDIAARDPRFTVTSFLEGARYAFELVVDAYARGDRATLKPLLSEKLFKDFDAGITAREKAEQVQVITSRRVRDLRITAAHLGGVMAYVTVAYQTDEPVKDIWTFARDTRTADPNWTLVETKAI